MATKKPTKKKKTDEQVKKETEQAVQVVEKIIVKEPSEVSTEFQKFTPAQLSLIKRTIAQDATDDELSMFIQVCSSSKLNPFLRQIHFVKRWDSKLGKEVGAIQVGIDGLRSIADRTGAYVGSNEPIYTDERALTADTKNGKQEYTAPESCKVTVKKVVQGIVGEFTADAKWKEFYPGDKQGFMWRKMPYVMLGKCAEAQALRKAFPAQMSGLYVQEELDSINASDAERKRIAQQFETARHMIMGVSDVKQLKALQTKIQKSEKYDNEQKDQLNVAVNTQLAKLKKLGENKKKTHDAPTTTPEL